MNAAAIPGLTEGHSAQILDLFKTAPAGSEILLFGSRAKGTHREGSDIDIAVKGDAVSLEMRDAWLASYEALYLPWKLDLVVYRLISEPALKAHIDRIGKTLLKP